VNPVSPETSDAIKRIAALLVKETARKRNKREKLFHETEKPNIPQERKHAERIKPISLAQENSTEQQEEDELSHSSPDSPLCVNIDAREAEEDVYPLTLSREKKNTVNPQEGTNDEERKGDLDTQPLSLVVEGTAKATSPPLSTHYPDEAHQSHNILKSSPRVIEDKEPVREESVSQPLSLVAGSEIDVTAPPLRGESSRERKKFEQRMHNILGVSPRVAVDDGKKGEVFDQQAKSVAVRNAVKVSAPFLRNEVSPERQAKEQWALGIPVASPMVAEYEAATAEFDQQPLSVVKESVADVRSSPLLRESATEQKNEEQPVKDVLCAWPQPRAQ
jgi:hypothetical protein